MPGSNEQRRAASSWEARPRLASFLRVVFFLIPFAVGWLAIRLTQRWFIDGDGWVGLIVWLVQAIVVSTIAVQLTTKVVHRFSPLLFLFELSLAFPDYAPSRFRTALRTSTVARLQRRAALTLSDDVQTASEQAVQLVAALSRHDRMTRGHTERVRAYADVIAQEMRLSHDELEHLRWGMLLHDIGKLNVPVEILNKPGTPTDAEWAIIRTHPAQAARLLLPLEPWLGHWVLAATEHHEWWDGNGYPLGLAGDEISLPGRICAVADAFDVITARRSYKNALSAEAAREELVASSGTQFDPAVVRAMLNAGLKREGVRVGWAWLLELPGFARIAAVGSHGFTVAASTAAAVAVAVSGAALPALDAPQELAFEAAPGVEVDFAGVRAETPAFPTTSMPSAADDRSPSGDDGSSTGAPDADIPAVPDVNDPTGEGPDTDIEPGTGTDAGTVDNPSPGTGGDGGPVGADNPVANTSTTGAGAQPQTNATAPTSTATPATNAPTSTTTTPTDCQLAQGGEMGLANAALGGCDLANLVLTNFDLAGADLRGATLDGARLTSGSLKGANLTNASLEGVIIENVDIAYATATEADFGSADLRNVSFGFANLQNATFESAVFTGTNFNDATISGANFRQTTNNGAEYYRTVAAGTDFRSADLRWSPMTDARLTNARLNDARLQNTTLDTTSLAGVDLTGANLEASTGYPTDFGSATYGNTVCPDGTQRNASCW